MPLTYKDVKRLFQMRPATTRGDSFRLIRIDRLLQPGQGCTRFRSIGHGAPGSLQGPHESQKLEMRNG